ncbi:hypothetical protein [Pontibacter sp. BAB1700]|uniref:hypothetical protein n=1 Tax=Pontibacter sp. BAB1700 TaxID=1144253 RepID=UPI000302207F
MAKIRHNNIIDTVDSVLSVSKKKGIIHLHAEDQNLSGQHLTLHGKQVLHFGTCGYLGLEHHPQVKRGAIDAIERYGTQFPMSRTYISNPLYRELEVLIKQLYNAPVVISKNCTLSHLTVIPSIIRQSDLVILDHQVHASVQEAVKKLLSQGVTVEMVRHNNLEMLEDRIKKQRGKFERIWYMADSVYSMYGDFAPIKDPDCPRRKIRAAIPVRGRCARHELGWQTWYRLCHEPNAGWSLPQNDPDRQSGQGLWCLRRPVTLPE